MNDEHLRFVAEAWSKKPFWRPSMTTSMRISN